MTVNLVSDGFPMTPILVYVNLDIKTTVITQSKVALDIASIGLPELKWYDKNTMKTLTIAGPVAIPVSEMEVPSVHCSTGGEVEHNIIISPVRRIVRERVKSLPNVHFAVGPDPDIILTAIGATSHVAVSVSITCRICMLVTEL